VKNGSIEVALEGEMTFPGKKPDANVTIDVAGYDKIVASLQEAAKTEPEAAQYFPIALAIKGFGKTLPDGRIEWAINAKPDGSVIVNGAMLKQPDPVTDDSTDQDASPGEGNSGGAGAKLKP
jgi:acylphosphatase